MSQPKTRDKDCNPLKFMVPFFRTYTLIQDILQRKPLLNHGKPDCIFSNQVEFLIHAPPPFFKELISFRLKKIFSLGKYDFYLSNFVPQKGMVFGEGGG